MDKDKLPKGVSALPAGIDIRSNKLRITFMLDGRRYREYLPGSVAITKSSIKYAENKRNTILTEIAEKRFNFQSHFPDSARVNEFSGLPRKRRTVEEGVTHWLEVQEATKAQSTIRGYKSKSKYVKAKFGKRFIADISRSELVLFQAELLKGGLSPKTVNDTMTVVRGVWSDAFHDDVIQSNPLDRIPNIEQDNLEETADPFTRDELARIEQIQTSRQGDIYMIMFWCWSGLSMSEVIALAWEDVDTVAWTVTVRRARVLNSYKVPKEKGRVRTIELLEPAKQWLRRQMQQTMMKPPVTLSVRQRDNITSRSEEVRFVFLNSQSGLPWYDHSLRRWFTGLLKRAKLRHRGPNQCRHTFASQCLSSYVPLEWVARQLGHSDTTMIKKHYGRWIPKDSQKMADKVSAMLGFEADKGGLGNANFATHLPQSKNGNQ